MALNIRSDTVNRLATLLAARARVSKTEAVRLALEAELRRREAMPALRERVRAIQDRVAASPVTGLEADKAFFDELSGEA